MTSDPVLSKSFRGFQSGFADFRLDWTDIFDIEGLLSGFDFGDTSRKLLVDVGGSRKLPLLSSCSISYRFTFRGSPRLSSFLLKELRNRIIECLSQILRKVKAVVWCWPRRKSLKMCPKPTASSTDGVDLLRVIAKKPDIPEGFLVLQDLLEVLSTVEISEKIELMPHDFFTEQPVVGTFHLPSTLCQLRSWGTSQLLLRI